jgi:hypothetical protein
MLELFPSKVVQDSSSQLGTDSIIFHGYGVHETNQGNSGGVSSNEVDNEHYACTQSDVHVCGPALWSHLTVLNRPCYVVLLPCGGRRRDGDIACQLAWTNCHDHYTVIGISIDVAVSIEFGDLCNHEVVSYWKGEIKHGRVVFMVMGPPCETWTQLREHIPEDWDGKKTLPRREFP